MGAGYFLDTKHTIIKDLMTVFLAWIGVAAAPKENEGLPPHLARECTDCARRNWATVLPKCVIHTSGVPKFGGKNILKGVVYISLSVLEMYSYMLNLFA